MALLILDIGSSSVRALLFDERALLIPDAVIRRETPFEIREDGAAEVDANHLRRLVEACIDDLLAHPAANTISMVGMTTFVGNLLGVDANGNPLTPVYTYADTRCAGDTLGLIGELDAEAVHQRTGCLIHSAYHPAKLRWLRRTQPELWEKARCWVDFGAYLYQGWFSKAVPCSYSVASWSGLLNRKVLAWDGEWLQLLGVRADQLPPLADYDAMQTGLSDAYAQRWPALRNAPFALAIGDGAAANIGSGAVQPNTAALTVGTTAALRRVSLASLPSVPSGLWSYRIDAAHHLIGGAANEGGNIFRWVRDAIQLPDRAALEAALLKRPPDGHGLTFLPLLAGERSPGWKLNASGTIHGLRLSTDPIDIAQAALEGVALRLAAIAAQFATPIQSAVASGGALEQSPAWVQMMADALALPITTLAEQELSARGIAILLLATNGHALAGFPPKVGSMVQPRDIGITALKSARERQAALYAQLYQ